MNRRLSILTLIFLGGLTIGCGTTKQARKMDVPKTSLLGFETSLLSKGEKDQMLLRYVKPGVDVNLYDSIYIDPVIFQRPEKASEEDINELQKLANNLYSYLQDELKNDFPLASERGPKTLRLQVAIFNAKKRAFVPNFLSSVVPVGVIPSVVKDFASGKPLAVGEVSAEIKITNAETGELLAAAFDRRIEEKYSSAAFHSWGDVDNAMKYWAHMIHSRFCQLFFEKKS